MNGALPKLSRKLSYASLLDGAAGRADAARAAIGDDNPSQEQELTRVGGFQMGVKQPTTLINKVFEAFEKRRMFFLTIYL